MVRIEKKKKEERNITVNTDTHSVLVAAIILLEVVSFGFCCLITEVC